MSDQLTATIAERCRLEKEYQRREQEIDSERHLPSNPAEVFIRGERKRVAARMLNSAGKFPECGDKCLEVGCGRGGWLSDLLSWGLRQKDLHGIDLSREVIDRACEIFPAANLRVADAAEMPYEDGAFNLVITSTVFTSILDKRVRSFVAREISRVLALGGALLWYDFAYNNPSNKHVRGINRKELQELFPELHGKIRSITLAPPIARKIAPRCWPLATLLEAIPLLRTHLIAVLTKF